jgi:hypothetical protein
MNYVFPADSVNGMTLKQKREAVAALRAAIKEEAIIRKVVRADAKAARLAAREAKKAAAIAKLEAKLAKMKSPKKPGPVTVYKGAEAARMAA